MFNLFIINVTDKLFLAARSATVPAKKTRSRAAVAASAKSTATRGKTRTMRVSARLPSPVPSSTEHSSRTKISAQRKAEAARLLGMCSYLFQYKQLTHCLLQPFKSELVL